ncbi:MAG: HDOD domain-containing protein [Planctomycetes bacterium]|nr:HDOD domain-containing protein [Planctomycetota bacterium]
MTTRCQAVLQEVMRGAKELPTLPHVIAKILRMTTSAESSAADISKLIANDPALSSRVLRLVNSAFYGFPRKVSNVTRAIVLLGFAKVRNLAVTASVAQMFTGLERPGEFSFRRYWEHAVATALASELIAKRVCPARADDAFVVGLLSELGKAMLAGRAPDLYRKVLAEVNELEIPVNQAAAQVLECDVASLGSEIAQYWNFPELLVQCLKHYRAPQKAPPEYREIAQCVHVADTLAGSLGWLGAGEKFVADVDGVALMELKVDEAGLTQDANTLLKSYDTSAAVLQMAA